MKPTQDRYHNSFGRPLRVRPRMEHVALLLGRIHALSPAKKALWYAMLPNNEEGWRKRRTRRLVCAQWLEEAGLLDSAVFQNAS